MCEVADRSRKLEVVESPQPFNKGPEALLEMNITGKCGCKLIIFVVLWRQVFEQVENQAMLVV